MRIRTGGEKEYRQAIIQGLASDLDENQTDALVDAAEHTRADIQAKRKLGEWVTGQIEAGAMSVPQARELLELFQGPDFVAEPALEVAIESGIEYEVTVDSAEPDSAIRR